MNTARKFWMCLILVIEYIQIGVGVSWTTGFGRFAPESPQPFIGIGLIAIAIMVGVIAVTQYKESQRS